MGYGRHVKLQGRGSAGLLANADIIVSVLHLILPMQDGLHVYSAEDGSKLFGVSIRGATHAAIHTWPVLAFFTLDILGRSCPDDKLAEQTVIQRLGAYNVQTTDLSRALDYPAEW